MNHIYGRNKNHRGESRGEETGTAKEQNKNHIGRKIRKLESHGVPDKYQTLALRAVMEGW